MNTENKKGKKEREALAGQSEHTSRRGRAPAVIMGHTLGRKKKGRAVIGRRGGNPSSASAAPSAGGKKREKNTNEIKT